MQLDGSTSECGSLDLLYNSSIALDNEMMNVYQRLTAAFMVEHFDAPAELLGLVASGYVMIATSLVNSDT